MNWRYWDLSISFILAVYSRYLLMSNQLWLIRFVSYILVKIVHKLYEFEKYLTGAFFFRIARTVVWLGWWDRISWIKMKIATYCLLLLISWWTLGFEKECSHWKFNAYSKYRLHNIQSVKDNSVIVYHSTREK